MVHLGHRKVVYSFIGSEYNSPFEPQRVVGVGNVRNGVLVRFQHELDGCTIGVPKIIIHATCSSNPFQRLFP